MAPSQHTNNKQHTTSSNSTKRIRSSSFDQGSDYAAKKQKRDNINKIIVILCTTMIAFGGSLMMGVVMATLDETLRRSEIARNRKPNPERKDWSEYDRRLLAEDYQERIFSHLERQVKSDV